MTSDRLEKLDGFSRRKMSFGDLALILQATGVITSLLKWKEPVLEMLKNQDSKTAQGSHVSSQE